VFEGVVKQLIQYLKADCLQTMRLDLLYNDYAIVDCHYNIVHVYHAVVAIARSAGTSIFMKLRRRAYSAEAVSQQKFYYTPTFSENAAVISIISVKCK
jgi:hypothetical protein